MNLCSWIPSVKSLRTSDGRNRSLPRRPASVEKFLDIVFSILYIGVAFGINLPRTISWSKA